MKTDWSDEEVHRFISEQINYYGFEVSPDQSKFGISPWKQWLWLERSGFDFAYQSLEREINQFRLQEEPSGVPLAAERRLLLSVRNVMRRVLSLPYLSRSDEQELLQAVPISNWTHWLYIGKRSGGDVDEGIDLGHIVNFTWNYIESDRPSYLSILSKIKAYDDSNPEEFDDTYTINGRYSLLMGPSQKKRMYGKVCGFHIARAYDMFLVPGNYKLYKMLGEAFMNSIDTRI